MAGEDLLQIRVTADFKQAEESFLKLSKTATTFESDIRKISANVSREFNKIEGSAELFGNSTTVIADKMKVLKNAMENLMSLGFQAMNPHVQKLKAQYDELTDEQKEGLEATFKSLLTLDPETAKHFVRSISRFNSIEEISDELHNISLKSARGGEWNIGGAYGEEEEDEPEWNIGR